MKVSCIKHVLAALIAIAVTISSLPALAAETKAIEVPPSTMDDQATTTDNGEPSDADTTGDAGEATVAREVPVMEDESLRQVGDTAEPLAREVAPGTMPVPGFETLGGERHSIDTFDTGVIRLGDTGSLYSMENDAYETRLYMPARRSTMGYTPFGTPTRIDPRKPRWEVSGSLAGGIGSATYADNDFGEFKLRESLTNLQGNYFEFYQGYLLDKSYIEAATLTIGARQRFNDWLWNGDLRLTEEYKYYENQDYSQYDRQEGLFALRFDPESDDGRLKGSLDYKYRIRLYDDFSTRSYKYHSARTELTYELAPELAATGRYRLDDYKYSTGSNYSNDRQAVSGELDWEATDNLRFTAGVLSETKTYDTDDSRTYDKVEYEGKVRWEPAGGSQVELRGEVTDYQREYNTTEDYDDRKVSLRYRQDLGPKVDIDLYGAVRAKEYDNDSTRDLDMDEARFRVNYNPNYNWNMYAGYGYTDYDYTTDTRAFVRTVLDAGISYLYGGWRAGIGWNRYETEFDVNTVTDYTRDDVDLTVDYRRDRNRWRVYCGLGTFDQVNSSSSNGYDETRLGLGWDIDLDPATRLKLSYDFNKRDYELFTDYDYSQVGAKIEFDL